MTTPATTPPTPPTRRSCDHDPRTDAVARAVAPHLYDLAHHPHAKPGHLEAYADVLWTTALALHHGGEYDATHPPPAAQHTGAQVSAQASATDTLGPDDYAELHAEFLESRQQYAAAGLLRELTVAPARAADGTLIGDPPTGTLTAVPPRAPRTVLPFRR